MSRCPQRLLFALFSAAASLLLLGCGRPVQVVVPPGFHGDLVVHCTSTGVSGVMLQANSDGIADGVCPSVETGVRVFREGREVQLGAAPGWTVTSDGIPTGVHVEVN